VARAEIRRKFMPKTAGPDFPIIVTSFEVAMLDARFLAHYQWKYVVVDEVAEKNRCYILLLFYGLFPILYSRVRSMISTGASVEKF
jgi:hypothetical protein